MRQGIPRNLYNIFFTAVCAGFCFTVAGIFIVRSAGFCLYPYPIENGEGICLHMAQLLKEGNLYKPLNELPLIVANYPPVYFFLNWVSIPSNIFMWGRCVSTLATLGIGVVVFLILKRYTRMNSIGFIAVSVLFMYPWLNLSGMLYRVDMLAAFFSILGFFVFFSNVRRARLIAAVFFMLGLYTKHTVWAGPLAAYTCLIIQDRKQGIRDFLIFIASGAGIFVILTLITRGCFFRHLVMYNVYNYKLSQLWHFLKIFIKDTGIIWIPSIIGFTSVCRSNRPILLYTIFSFALLGMLGREGASAHYFLESAIAVALIGAIGINELQLKKRRFYLNALIVVLLLGGHLYMNRGVFQKITIDEKYKLIMSLLHKEIINEKGKVLAEDNGVIVMTGKTVYVHTFAISKLIEQGVMRPDIFYDMIANREFALIVLNSNLEKLSRFTYSRFTKEALMLIYKNYKFEKQIGNNYLYRRKPQ